ncbi:zinc-binding dehydrogenase [Streptomyces sp. NBC_01799]|uniref:zinc-binding dehydrogenase n=1 Tax=Streptomyces sp. NBC_01800 TaxID=2975945 RepID=UPI002DD823DE|nr:zinc-binding dehydrogenase [Streptomyces sp. NBC_01800]WSA69128.1 zinc-binding dehydrogenase [Streptomyces sp. NBC_01800]WSA77615.1 zinc-binding dehydrogenase [Streptomyces sp. NBC_01799]
MRVALVRELGGPAVLVPAEMPDPVPGAGEVVIDVSHVDTIFVETQIRSGSFSDYFPVRPPYVPGGGIAGTVRSVGEGVDAGWADRRVIASVGFTGGYAEQAAASADHLVPVPDGLGLREAAALAHDGVTAAALMEANTPGPGERVLILGASGGMGTLLVQLTHAAGAHVVAVARGDRKTALVRELGADDVIDGADAGWVEQARTALEAAGGPADVVLDGVGGAMGAAAFTLTADGGRFSAHGAPTGGFAPIDPQEAARRGITLRGIGDVQLTDAEYVRLAGHALGEAAAGRLRPVIGHVYPLEQAAEAHTAIEERGLLGKVLLSTREE